MEIVIRGCRLKLTPDQIKKLDKSDAESKKCLSSFERTLKRFGFKQIADLPPGHFEHKKNDWYAEISNRNDYYIVLMVGEGLKQSPFPGGWIYYDVQELQKELLKAIK